MRLLPVIYHYWWGRPRRLPIYQMLWIDWKRNQLLSYNISAKGRHVLATAQNLKFRSYSDGAYEARIVNNIIL